MQDSVVDTAPDILKSLRIIWFVQQVFASNKLFFCSPSAARCSAVISKSEDGLCWWRADGKEGPVETPKARKKNAKASTERGEQGVEFYTAAVEAHACGAQVLLGDRDFEVHFLLSWLKLHLREEHWNSF